AIEAPIKASSLMFLRSLAEAGRGIIMIPAWMVQDSLRRGALVPVLTEATLEPPTTPINAVFAHHRQLAPKVRVLVDFLAAEMQALCPLPGSHSTLGQSSVTRVAVGSSSNPNHASTKS
ncbi:MAG: LysR substrate-binding domain-containing protein, partial [Mangrovicoccus sp.]